MPISKFNSIKRKSRNSNSRLILPIPLKGISSKELLSLLILLLWFRVTKLENAMRDKERVIDEMIVEKRNLEKIKRDQEKQIDVFRNERDYITKVRNQWIKAVELM